MQNRTIQLPASWLHHLEQEFQKPYIKDLKKNYKNVRKKKLPPILRDLKFLMPFI